MKCTAVLLLGLAAAAVRADGAFEIGTAMEDAAFWNSDPVLFVRRHQEQGFKFTSDDRRSSDSRREGGVTCFGLPVYESRVSFADRGGISRIELMLFNTAGTEHLVEVRLADGQTVRRLENREKAMSRAVFFRTIETVGARLTKAGKMPVPAEMRTRESAVHQRAQTWAKSVFPSAATLTWNYCQAGQRQETFRPGFIRLAVEGPAGLAAPSGQKGRKTLPVAKRIAENVIRDPRGDVFIDNVPMVDQGAKGYCAAAAAERVLRYYGLAVDEHEIADAAGTTAIGGTSTKALKAAVEAIGKRNRLATTLLYGDFDDDVEKRIANLGKEVANYNKAAKKLKRSPIEESVYVRREGNMTFFNVSAVDDAMDPEVLKEMKTDGAQRSRYVKFRRDVRQYVNAGMPLFWSVLLGTYPESDLPQAKGGHMRLIIGYNEKKDEVLYTDTWGKGHELKRMPAAWAWTITRALLAMKPLK